MFYSRDLTLEDDGVINSQVKASAPGGGSSLNAVPLSGMGGLLLSNRKAWLSRCPGGC